MDTLYFESKGEARSYYRYVNGTKRKITHLRFPAYRIVDDVGELAWCSISQWAIVENDIKRALKENSEDWELCERKIYE